MKVQVGTKKFSHEGKEHEMPIYAERHNKAGEGKTDFGDTKTAKDRLKGFKKKGIISKVLNKFKK